MEASENYQNSIMAQMKTLLDQELFSSAELLGNFCLTSLGANPSSEFLTLYGRILFGKSEYRRAITYFHKAIQTQRKEKKNAQSVDQDAHLKYLIASGHFKLNETKTAIAMLESIPMTSRSLQVHLQLAKFYHNSGNYRAAIAFYREVLRLNPFALEVILSLVEIGTNPSEIQELYRSHHSQVHVEWLQHVVEAHHLQSKHEYQKSLKILVKLEKQYTNNLYLLQRIAQCELQSGSSDSAKTIFERLRRVDPQYLDSMDAFASIIRAQGSAIELNRLCQELVQVNPQRPEVLSSIAMYYELKGAKEKSLMFVDKALENDERHVIAHLLKGNLMITLGHPEQAIMPFKKAILLNRDILAFSGLVRAYLALSKTKEAHAVAKEARRLMPHNSQALTLIGLVLSQVASPNAREKARLYFEEALKINDTCLDAVLGTSQLLVLEKKYKEAIDLLKQYLNRHDTDFLHTRLADVLVLVGNHAEAMEHYNAALSINPNSEVAKHGLERLEKIVKGIDPDLDDKEKEDEYEDDMGEIE